VNSPLFPALRAPALTDAIRDLSVADTTDRGAVYTRPEIVRTVLDLAGYTADRPLHTLRVVEPAFGGGDFLLPILERLLAAFTAHGGVPADAARLAGAIRAVEVHGHAFATTRSVLIDRLVAWGATRAAAARLADGWLVQDDFLLWSGAEPADFVVGNPPYVRQERIAAPLLEAYRRRYKTIYDRADLYVPFYERGLDLLKPSGRLAYICANRWIKNKYGGPLRSHAAAGFHLRYFIDLEGADAFHAEVIAYPAITVFERPSGRGAASLATRVARRPDLSDASLRSLVRAMTSPSAPRDARVEEVERATPTGDAPWLLDAPDRLRLLRRLEARLPDLEGAGCRVGIGVATGADRVFIGKYDALPVEPERKTPLVMARDLVGTRLVSQGWGVVNPFNPDGSFAAFAAWPRFGAYMTEHQPVLAARHCAQRSPSGWYRTIDRIWPDLTTTPKLLIPDIKGEPTVVYDPGQFYPHHNLYFVTSERWELPALATVLRSSLAVLFISSYCVRMSGGFLRFQAQYLRRIRVPAWETLTPGQRQALRAATDSLDLDIIDAAVASAYGLTPAEQAVVREAANEARVPRKSIA
jgi:hypothetical protein